MLLEYVAIKKVKYSLSEKHTTEHDLWKSNQNRWNRHLFTFEVGCTLADGWMYTSPTIVAVLLPSPEAKRWGEVRRNWERYNPEHLKDILLKMKQWYIKKFQYFKKEKDKKDICIPWGLDLFPKIKCLVCVQLLLSR